MIIDCNIIAYEYAKNQYTPSPIYVSGEKDGEEVIDRYNEGKESLPVLVIENDIVNKEGYGLKKGFYNVIPDEYLDFLLIYQTGKLKAKIPVVQTEILEPDNPEQEKIKKMSYKQYQRYIEKEKRKYYKGENPSEFNWQNTEIHYIDELKSYVLIYNSRNFRLLGIIKF